VVSQLHRPRRRRHHHRPARKRHHLPKLASRPRILHQLLPPRHLHDLSPPPSRRRRNPDPPRNQNARRVYSCLSRRVTSVPATALIPERLGHAIRNTQQEANFFSFFVPSNFPLLTSSPVFVRCHSHHKIPARNPRPGRCAMGASACLFSRCDCCSSRSSPRPRPALPSPARMSAALIRRAGPRPTSSKTAAPSGSSSPSGSDAIPTSS